MGGMQASWYHLQENEIDWSFCQKKKMGSPFLLINQIEAIFDDKNLPKKWLLLRQCVRNRPDPHFFSFVRKKTRCKLHILKLHITFCGRKHKFSRRFVWKQKMEEKTSTLPRPASNPNSISKRNQSCLKCKFRQLFSEVACIFANLAICKAALIFTIVAKNSTKN